MDERIIVTRKETTLNKENFQYIAYFNARELNDIIDFIDIMVNETNRTYKEGTRESLEYFLRAFEKSI